jgi:hypothetical protein
MHPRIDGRYKAHQVAVLHVKSFETQLTPPQPREGRPRPQLYSLNLSLHYIFPLLTFFNSTFPGVVVLYATISHPLFFSQFTHFQIRLRLELLSNI